METIKKVVIAKPKSAKTVLLQFKGLQDVPELVQMTGFAPKVNTDGTLKIKKFNLNPPCLIEVDQTGVIKDVHTVEDFDKNFEVIEEKVFSDSFAFSVPSKEKTK